MADELLNRNAMRLLREQWRTPAALAQELYMMTADDGQKPHPPQHMFDRMERMAGNVPHNAEHGPDRSGSVLRASPLSGVVRQPSPSLGDQVAQAKARASQVPFQLPGLPGLPAAGIPAFDGGPSVVRPQISGQAYGPDFAKPASHYEAPARPSQPAPSPPVQSRIPASTPDLPPQVADYLAGHRRGTSTTVDTRHNLAPVQFASQVFSTLSTGTIQGPPVINPPQPRIYRPAPELSLPAHIAYDAAIPIGNSYEPLGLPKAYSGQERSVAPPYSPDQPRIERDPRDPFAKHYYELTFPVPDFDSPRPSGGGGTTTVPGKVLSSSGSTSDGPQTVTVQLYSNGVDSDPDSGNVQVTIPFLAANENVPVGTWLEVMKVGSKFNSQPPTWLD
jgi:hypothetical protein